MNLTSISITLQDGVPISLADCREQVVSERYFLDETLTICVLTLKNGFKVTGECAAASIETFDEEVGKVLARRRAEEKIWPLLGFLKKNEELKLEQRGT